MMLGASPPKGRVWAMAEGSWWHAAEARSSVTLGPPLGSGGSPLQPATAEHPSQHLLQPSGGQWDSTLFFSSKMTFPSSSCEVRTWHRCAAPTSRHASPWAGSGAARVSQNRGNYSLFPESQPTTSDETVVAGGTVVLKCQVEDPDDSSLQWSNPAQQTLYFGEKRALRDNRIQLQRSTPNELTISITDVVLADEGEYTCSIFTMPVRTAKALVTVLGIPQKPQIFGHEQPIDEEKIARLTCRSSGSKPAAQLRWKKGNKELKAEGTEVVEDPNGKTFTVSSRVEFRVTKEDNDAEVTCTVDHESLQNSERSTTQKLQVHYKPTAKIEPHPLYPREGEKLQLQCDGQGN
uniref:Ig-like domain-containing protein n=1 Tax=Anas zonorhyncha TaxID=75864 RepID=A0A8B9V3J3_9AVES